MPQINFAKVSNTLIVTQTAGSGKYYAATAIAQAKFNPNNQLTRINIYVGGDSYDIAFGDLSVNGQTPTTMTTALVLLNSIFGS